MNKINILYLLIIPIKHIILLLLWIIATALLISYIGSVYTSNHIFFALTAIVSMLILCLICIFIGIDLSKKFKKYNNSKNIGGQNHGNDSNHTRESTSKC